MDVITISNVVIQLMKDVIDEDQIRHILQTDFTGMEFLLGYITTDFKDRLPEAAPETMKIWLQLLHNCLTHAKTILHRSDSPQRCLHCFMYCNPGRQLSKEIKEWKLLYDNLFQSFHQDISIFASAREVFIAPFIVPVVSLMKDLIEGEKSSHILQTDQLSPMDTLLLDISTVFQDQQKAGPENLKIWLQLLRNSLTRATTILRRSSDLQRPGDCVIRNPGRLSKQIEGWKVLFNYIFKGLQKDFLAFLSSPEVVIAPFIAPVIPVMEDVIREEENRHNLQTELRAMLNLLLDMSAVFQDQQKAGPRILKLWLQLLHDYLGESLHLMCNPGRVSEEIHEWKARFDCLFQDLQRDFSIFVTADQIIHSTDPLPPLRADQELREQLYQSYDALPTSDLKNCFLYSAISYEEDAKISVRDMVQMWIAEGLVRSKQETHLMDMAIARTYVNLLLDRCFFRNVTDYDGEIRSQYSSWHSSDGQQIRVDGDIREMAMSIADKEQNCLFKAGKGPQEMFPSTEDINDCKRISLRGNEIEDLPSELPCPKLVSLILCDNRISVVPSGFLVGLTSLKVLDLSRNEKISSIPSSVGQLQQLQLLRLEGLSIKDLPEEIGHLSSLQFLSLYECGSLESLPSQIGQLQNLKYLNISECGELRVIPHEISQLTSLTTLDAVFVYLSVEAESERSICRLKGLINLTMLRIHVVTERNTRSSDRIEGGIMGTWLDMRHLELDMRHLELDDLPDDMQIMRKLQSFIMSSYNGLSLPQYISKFQNLQYLGLRGCEHLKELNPLELLPSLKYLDLDTLPNLKELGIGNCGKGNGFLMLQKLVLRNLCQLESMAGPSNNGVWNQKTLPSLRILKITYCPNLKRLPLGMDKLLNLKTLKGQSEWWQQIIWEDKDMNTHFVNLFKEIGFSL